MALATGSQALLTYIREVTWGTTPGTPSMVVLPVSSAKMYRTTAESNDKVIRSDRQVVSWYGGARESMLEVEFPLRAVAFNDILSMALWCADQPSNPYTYLGGTTPLSATFELMHTDISVYEKLLGGMCDSLTLSAPDANIVNCKATFRGSAYSISGTSLDGAPTNPTAEDPITTISYSAANTVVSTLASTLKVSAFEIKIENNLEDVRIVTRHSSQGVVSGRQKVSGSITVPFETATLMAAFNAETADGLTFTFRDAVSPVTRSFVVTLPNVKYSAAEAPVDGEGLIEVKLPFTALYDSGIGSSIQIVTTIL